MTLARFGTILIAVICPVLVAADEPRQLADVTPGTTTPLQATGFAKAPDGTMVLAGCDHAHGCEVFATDATSAGTRLLGDTQPGPCSEGLSFFSPCVSSGRLAPIVKLIPGEGTLFALQTAPFMTWFGWTDTGGYSDTGTLYRVEPSGLHTLADVLVSPFIPPVSLKGILYFAGSRPPRGDLNVRYVLWRSDGSRAGTYQVSDIEPNVLRVAFDRLYIRNWTPDRSGVWTSDGTLRGTVPAPSQTREAAACVTSGAPITDPGGNEVFVCSGSGATSGTAAVWRTDGTAGGTYPLTYAATLPPIVFGAFFGGTRRAYWLAGNFQIGTTDGTSQGTRVLARAIPDSRSGTISGERLFFTVRGAPGVGQELWVSDGTDAGTHLVVDLFPGQMVPFDGGVAFVSYSLSGPQGLYRSDGTAAGTFLLAPAGPPINGLTNLEGTLWFSRSDGIFRSHGTPATTVLALDSFSGADSKLLARENLPNRMLLSVADAKTGLVSRLLSADGRNADELSVAEMNPDLRLVPGGLFAPRGAGKGAGPLSRALVAGTCRDGFPACLGTTDGTNGGTRLLARGLDVSAAAPLKEGLLLACGECEERLWQTDGTAEGTRPAPLGERRPGSAVLDLHSLGNGRALFTVARARGIEIGITDGSETGTRLLSDGLFALPTESVTLLARLGARTLFTAERAIVSGMPLSFVFATDGRPESEPLVVDVTLTALDARDGIALLGTREQWFRLRGTSEVLLRTDGTAAGTYDIFPGLAPRMPRSGRRVDGGFLVTVDQGIQKRPFAYWFTGPAQDLYFVPDSPSGRPELLLSDSGVLRGLVNGRALLARVRGFDVWNLGGSLRMEIVALDPKTRRTETLGCSTVFDDEAFLTFETHGNRAFFKAADPEHGIELWRTDGTATGTFRVTDLARGPASSSPTLPRFLGSTAFVIANDGLTGLEPWSLPEALLDIPPADANRRLPCDEP